MDANFKKERELLNFSYYRGDNYSISLEFSDVNFRGYTASCANLCEMCARFAFALGYSEEEIKRYFNI